MKVVLIIMAVLWVWIVVEMITAPLMDEDGNIKRKKK